MIFLKIKLLPFLIVAIFVFAALYVLLEKKFFSWVKEHWLLERKFSSRLSSLCFLLGLSLLSVVLLDPRSGEQKIKGMVKQDKTIILIDTSTSMLTEDIRPNRLEKSVLIAKHFSRKAVGHQISVMVFADITKKIVPFTSDLDLLDSRIDSVKMLKNMNAGSSIGLAIEEAVRYFDPKNEGVAGNILVITDGEDNADTESFKVPEGINLALVGVGTRNGGPIPMKDNFGMFYGQKKSHGVTVISRLNEEFFKKATSDNPNSKYFIVENYDLPTEEILDFFSKQKTAEKEGENIIRPVALERWAVPGLVLISMSLILRFFKPIGLAIFLALSLTNLSAQEKNEVQIPIEVQERLDLFKAGKLTRDEKINLADQLVKLKMHESAQKIYKENFEIKDHLTKTDSYFNWATSELETGKIQEALSKYSEIEDESVRGNVDKAFKQKINENIKKMLVAPPSKDKNKSKEEKDKDKKDQEKNQGNSGESDPKEGESKQGKGKGESGENSDKDESKKNPFDPKNKDEPKESKDGNESKGQGDKPKDDEKTKSPSDKEGDERGERKPKVSPLLEQLKQDDRKLQLKLLDTSTQKRKEGRKKDW
ncbi:MAG: VWA domain-containing protein [Bacteriovoracaceae bacterium]|nr:VWA domain-containing protein [Bacteriovoracaceae bacterium]